jgi:DegV family protein with EDD domain
MPGNVRFMPPPVALVTDSVASLPIETAAERGITVVPLQVVVGDTSYDEGADGPATPQRIAEALRARTRVRTSRPTPSAFAETYRKVAAEGAAEIVASHLSGELSGTCESAQAAAREAPVPVRVVDTRQVGMGVGFAVLAAADVLDGGGSADQAAQAARARAEATTSLFYVDTLEYLHRGGRIGAAAALLGSALAVKPLLTVTDGRVDTLEKVRTSARALTRLGDLAVDAAGAAQVDLAVAHLANPEQAARLAELLSGRLAEKLSGRQVLSVEVGPVIGAHAGPGMVAVVVARR